MKKVKENQKGITLIALIITIIVLLILAGITISALTGENGIIQKASEAREQTEISNIIEQARLDITQLQMDKLGENLTEEELETIVLNYGSFEASEESKDLLDKILTTENGYKIKVSDIYNGTLTSSDSLPMKIKVNTGADGTVVLPISEDEDCTVDWGDGQTTETISHTYTETNVEKTVTINGSVKAIDTYTYGNPEQILEIEQWGETGLESVVLQGCENLRKIASPSKNSFTNLKNVEYEYGSTLMFSLSNCTSLKEIPSDLFKYCNNAIGFCETFSECTSLTSIPENLFASCPNVTDFSDTFSGCTSLTSIPENLFASCPNVTSFANTFSGCEGLTSIPENLFANCTNVQSFESTFFDCTGLTGKPIELWTRGDNNEGNEYNGTPNGQGCYYNCTGLDGYDNIPEYWKTSLNPS